MNNLDVETGTLIFNNGLTFRKHESKEMNEIILMDKKVPSEYKIPLNDTIRGLTLDVLSDTMRERQTSALLNKAEMFGLSGSGDGSTVKNNPFNNSIVHGTHHIVAVHDILIALDMWREVIQIITIL